MGPTGALDVLQLEFGPELEHGSPCPPPVPLATPSLYNEAIRITSRGGPYGCEKLMVSYPSGPAVLNLPCSASPRYNFSSSLTPKARDVYCQLHTVRDVHLNV